MFEQINKIITVIDEAVWGLPLICLIMATGIFLTVRLGLLQIRHLGKAFKFMVKNEEDGEGEVTSFGALCTALSATIGTGNITGVATAIAAGGPGALVWMVVAAFFGMATKYAEGLLAIKYRTIDKEGHVLGGPFYYIENGMGKNWKWLAKIFAFFGACVGLFGIGTFTQVNSIASAVKDFFDPETSHVLFTAFGRDYSVATVVTGLFLTLCVGLVYSGNGVLGLGGGSTFGAYQQAWLQHYWNTYSCEIMFHELGHVMGYSHSSSFTYGPWAQQLMNNFYVTHLKDFPIDSPRHLESSSNATLYR